MRESFAEEFSISGLLLGSMILIIDNYDSFTFNLYQQIKGLSSQATVIVHRNDQITLGETLKMPLSALIISPGPGGPESTGVCWDLLPHYFGKIPILGVCLGHQMIAAYFGAKIRSAHSILHGKTSLITHHQDEIFSGCSNPMTVARYHSLAIDREDLPGSLTEIASLSDGEIMAIRVKGAPVWGIQFHPESFLTIDGDKLMENFLAQIA